MNEEEGVFLADLAPEEEEGAVAMVVAVTAEHDDEATADLEETVLDEGQEV